MSSRILTGAAALVALASCSADAPPPPAPPTPQATILDDQLRAIERAKSVEATLQATKDRADAALEEAEGG